MLRWALPAVSPAGVPLHLLVLALTVRIRCTAWHETPQRCQWCNAISQALLPRPHPSRSRATRLGRCRGCSRCLLLLLAFTAASASVLRHRGSAAPQMNQGDSDSLRLVALKTSSSGECVDRLVTSRDGDGLDDDATQRLLSAGADGKATPAGGPTSLLQKLTRVLSALW